MGKKRETNAPLPTPAEVSRQITALDPHRRPTIPGVPSQLLDGERVIGNDTRRHRTLARYRAAFNLGMIWFTRAGSLAGFVSLGWLIWRAWR